ncbi:glycosyltransferase family 2 protein [Vibrio fluminensis]|uniref:glycosyltransferase family 2 protein n=1 Tax=Vibrio fluminensis TaxID=2783614 RepID=UPI001889AA86|nr:glycosyltransferase [Vibrio fluminensis]
MSISIIIPSYCAEDNLPACLDSIDAQHKSVEQLEVVVVDCSPHDKVAQVCQNYAFVKYVHTPERFNPGEGRNIGTRESSGETLVFVDGDIVLEQNALVKIEENVARGNLVFGAALDLNEKKDVTFSSYVEHFYFNHESHSSRPETVRSNLSSAFLIINRKVFVEAGGFKDIPRMQDTELTERLVQSGYELKLAPEVVGYQIQDSPLAKVLKKIKITGNNIYFIRYEEKASTLTKFALLLLLPLMMLAKITRINVRNIRYAFSSKMLFVYAPFMYVCGLYWMSGFYKAILFNKGIESKR